MLIIAELNRILIEEYGSRLQEGDTVLLQVGAALRLIPLERNYTYIVCTRTDLSISGPNAKVSGIQHGAIARAKNGEAMPERVRSAECPSERSERLD